MSLVEFLLPDPAPHVNSRAERVSAIVVGFLHIFLAAAAQLMVIGERILPVESMRIWASAEILMAIFSWIAAYNAYRGSPRIFGLFVRLENFFTLFIIAALPWLNPSTVGQAELRTIYLCTLIAYTSAQGSNSVQLPRRRPFFTWLIIPSIMLSYGLVYFINGVYGYAICSFLWCITIVSMTRLGYTSLKEEIERRQQSEELASTDSLTGLLSRTAFLNELDLASEREDSSALALIDLDGFKAINDTFGHPTGDIVLHEVAGRLRRSMPQGTSIGRLGGDEFAVIIPVDNPATFDIEGVIEKSLALVARAINIAGREIFVSASAGWTIFGSESTSASLIAEADAAMYQSKTSNTQNLTSFNPDLRAELDRSLELRQDFRAALKKRRIMHYGQPIVRLSDGYPIAVELLARWQGSDGSFIPPSEFTRVAEETGLAVELDAQSLEAAQTVISKWNTPELSHLTAKVNISPFHLSNQMLTQTVSRRVNPKSVARMGLELLESRLISSDDKVRDQMAQLRDLGMQISIDDFGVGYSSLAYLRELPITEVKIDMSFVRDLHRDKINQGLVQAIVEIATTLGLPTVAEGIETRADYNKARELGVTYGQGFFISRPMPFSALNLWLAENTKPMTHDEISAGSATTL